MKKYLGIGVALATVAAFAIFGLQVLERMSLRPRTDASFLLANIANLAPEVSGRIIQLNVQNNQPVKKGDVLFVIDPEPFQLKLNSAKAQLRAATKSLARARPLQKRGYTAVEQVDQLQAARDSAAATKALAERDLHNTVIKAPFDGYVLGLTVRDGEYASAGKPLFTLVDSSKWFAVANFRETEIARMKPGTPATVFVMGQTDRPVQGHVESIGWGVVPDDAKLLGGIPQIPKTLNWVRLAQRFPVRILLDNPPKDMMRLGASSVVVVRHEGKE